MRQQSEIVTQLPPQDRQVDLTLQRLHPRPDAPPAVAADVPQDSRVGLLSYEYFVEFESSAVNESVEGLGLFPENESQFVGPDAFEEPQSRGLCFSEGNAVTGEVSHGRYSKLCKVEEQLFVSPALQRPVIEIPYVKPQIRIFLLHIILQVKIFFELRVIYFFISGQFHPLPYILLTVVQNSHQKILFIDIIVRLFQKNEEIIFTIFYFFSFFDHLPRWLKREPFFLLELDHEKHDYC